MLKKFLKYFSVTEWILWLISITVITVSFAASNERSVLSYLSSFAGVTCVIVNAKGNALGQAVSIAFALLYALYAYTQRYYGEMLIYLCLMLPIHVISIISWVRNKFDGRAHEVKINTLRPLEYILTAVGAAAVTVGFYFLLRALNTDNLIVSTISLTTSITAAYLMLRRCEYFSILFILNDVVLIILWSMKIPTAGLQVLPSVMGFIMFLANDTYCFISWHKIKRRQRAQTTAVESESTADANPERTDQCDE